MHAHVNRIFANLLYLRAIKTIKFTLLKEVVECGVIMQINCIRFIVTAPNVVEGIARHFFAQLKYWYTLNYVQCASLVWYQSATGRQEGFMGYFYLFNGLFKHNKLSAELQSAHNREKNEREKTLKTSNCF